MTNSTYLRIYKIIRRIPPGRVATYGTIARVSGASGARQVGYALHAAGDNALPWHRVVNARGTVSLAGHAAITQRLRLEAEGVRFDQRGRIDLDRFGWSPRRKEYAARRRP